MFPYMHLKTESLQSLKTLLHMNDCMYKLDLKDAYLNVPISLEDNKRIELCFNETGFVTSFFAFVLDFIQPHACS